MIVEDAVEQGSVAGITNYELARGNGRLKPGRQVVEGNDVLAVGAELAHDVAADVAGAACDENLAVIH